METGLFYKGEAGGGACNLLKRRIKTDVHPPYVLQAVSKARRATLPLTPPASHAKCLGVGKASLAHAQWNDEAKPGPRLRVLSETLTP